MKKIVKWVSIGLGICLFLFFVSWRFDFGKGKAFTWGATFSQFYAKEFLNLDWQKTYEAILNELPFQKLRLIAYWQYLEPQESLFTFDDLDWQIKKAQEKGKEITLVLGNRVPRWPECHAPDWAKKLSKEEFQSSLLGYIENIINRYKSHSSIRAWQVENEPFLSMFGECPLFDKEFFQKEIALVKKLDPTRPVIITESGELSLWTDAAPLADIVGTTLYRIVWNSALEARWKHFIPPAMYALRANSIMRHYGVKDVIISELQAEPWAPGVASIGFVEFDKQTKDFNLGDMKDNVEFAKKTGIREIYLWGVEWWYLREQKGDPSWMQFGKTLK